MQEAGRALVGWSQRSVGSWLGFLFSSACPLGVAVDGGLKRSKSRRLGWEKEDREHTVTIRTGCAWSLSLRRSGFLLSQCFLTHFLSLQSDIYLTLQLCCSGNAKFGGCKRSPCCRVYTWRLTHSAHMHVWAQAALGHTHTCAQGTHACQCVCRGGTSLPVHCRAPVGSKAQTPASTSVSITLCSGTGTAVTDPSYMLQTDLPMPSPHDTGDESHYVFCAPGPKSLHTYQVYWAHK